MRMRSFVVATAVLAAAACSEPPPKAPETCVSDDEYFSDEVWGAFMGTTCFACHNAQGVARSSDLVLKSSNEPGFLSQNFEIVKNVAAFENGGVSILLLKPSAQISHEGGEQIELDGKEYQALEELIARFQNPVVCEGGEENTLASHVELLDPARTFRKAAITVGGRLPTADELAQLEGGDEADLDAAIDNLLQEPGFENFVKEMWNDLFLTDRYNRDQRAVDLLDRGFFPDKEWFDEVPGDDATRRIRRARTNTAVAREAIELVAYVAKNDLPFTEILTADYMMVNPYSAKAYGVAADFKTNTEEEFVPARMTNYPHAGVLTSAMWLNRFPTTETNRNRHRARMVYKFFLATDILKLAQRVNASDIVTGTNPTRDTPACTVCHANIDPVAGALQAWTPTGTFEPPEQGWYPEMFAPGYGDEAMPPGEYNNGAHWLAERIAADPLFSLSMVHNFYRGLTGREPLGGPAADDTEYDAKNAAYTEQDAEFKRIADLFTASDFSARRLVKEVIKSPYFRATSLRGDVKDADKLALDSFGTGRFLTPELLSRKIAAVTGFAWLGEYSGRDQLLATDDYLVFYGGIDSDSITQRITEPNGLMAAVASRMAVEQACRTTARDFTRGPSDRKLFPFVDANFQPEDINGFEVQGAKNAILDNIVYLHERVLGEKLSKNDEEIQATYQLWLATWRAGVSSIATGAESASMPYTCQVNNTFTGGEPLPDEDRLTQDPGYTIRAWTAVMAYLMSDYRFLHE